MTTRNEVDIAYEEWAENFEAPGEFSENAFITGYRLGLHMACKECANVCDESTGAWLKKGAFKCFQRIMEKLNGNT